jgi:hypothetical protein
VGSLNEEPASKDERWGSRTKGTEHDQVRGRTRECEERNGGRGEERRDEETRRDVERRGEARRGETKRRDETRRDETGRGEARNADVANR